MSEIEFIFFNLDPLCAFYHLKKFFVSGSNFLIYLFLIGTGIIRILIQKKSLSIDSHQQQMIKNFSYIIRPMQIEMKEKLTEEQHRYSPPKIETEHFEMLIKHDNGFGNGKGKVTLKYNLHSLVELGVVKGGRYLSTISGNH